MPPTAPARAAIWVAPTLSPFPTESPPQRAPLWPGVQYGAWVLMLNRKMHPGLPEGDVALRIPTDRHGRPEVNQSLPEGWAGRGAVPLFVRAYDDSDSEVSLTPCANMTHTPLTVKDPHLLRFREVRGIESVTVGFSEPAKQGANG